MKIIVRVTALLISLALFLVGCADTNKINYDKGKPDSLRGFYSGITHTKFDIDFREGERIPVDQPFLINAKITFYDDVKLRYIWVGANSEKLYFECDELGVEKDGHNLLINIGELNSDSDGVKCYETKRNGLPVSTYCERSVVISAKCVTSEKYAGAISITIAGYATYINKYNKLVSVYGDKGDYLYFATDGEYIAFSTISRGTAESYLVYGGDGK